MPWPRSERAALAISTTVAATVGVVALVVASLTGSQAIRLDGLFNAIYFVVGLVTLRVGRWSSSPITINTLSATVISNPWSTPARGC